MFLSDSRHFEGPFQKALLAHSGKRVPNYESPKKQTLSHVSALVRAIDDRDEEATRRHMNALNMIAIRLDETNDGVQPGDDILLFAPRNTAGPMYAGFFFRLSESIPLCLQSPHEGVDGAFRVSVEMFCQTRAQSMVFNYCHKDSAKQQKHGRSISDWAHVTPHTGHTACQVAWNLIDYASVIQIHGMKGSANSHLLVHGTGRQFEPNSFPDLFARSLQRRFPESEHPKFKMADSKLAFPNDFGDTKGAIWSPQGEVLSHGIRGRFIHLETSPAFRGDEKWCADKRRKLNEAAVDAALARAKWLEDKLNPAPDASALSEHDDEDEAELMRGAGVTPKLADPEE